MAEQCDMPYPQRGDIRCCRLPLNHDDDCATANRTHAADTPTTEDRHG